MNTIEASVLPYRFSASIGGFMGESYSVELHDGTLTHTTPALTTPAPSKRLSGPRKHSGASSAAHSMPSTSGSGRAIIPTPAFSMVRTGPSILPTPTAHSRPTATTTILTRTANPLTSRTPLRPSTITFAQSKNSPGGTLNDSDRSASARTGRRGRRPVAQASQVAGRYIPYSRHPPSEIPLSTGLLPFTRTRWRSRPRPERPLRQACASGRFRW